MTASAPPDLQRLGSEYVRGAFIGGSDVAGILGVSSWATPADIYFRKKDPKQSKVDPLKERIYKRGKRMEPVVVEMVRDELGLDIVRVSTDLEPNRYRDAEVPYFAAEVDFEWRVRATDVAYFPWAAGLEVGSIQNAEVKTVGPFAASKWGEMDTDEVPIEYALQSLHGLGVTRRKACMYATLFGSDNLVTFAILRDDEVIAGVRRQLIDFWANHLAPGIPPPPRTIEDVQRMYLKPSLETRQADMAQLEHIAALHMAMDAKSAAEERITELQFQLMHSMGHVEALVDSRGRPLVTWKNSQWSGLNETRLKAERPDIHQQFYESRPMRRFLVTGRRK